MSRTTKRTIKEVDASHVNSQPSSKRMKLNNNSYQNVRRKKKHTDEISILTATCSSTVTAETDPAFGMVDLPNLYQNVNKNHNIPMSTNSKFSNKK